MIYFDNTYLILLPAMLFAAIAQMNVKSTFKKYSEEKNVSGLTGSEAARRILDQNGLDSVRIEHISGNITDNYNPSTNTINLSDDVYNNDSVAAVGVAAHEVGHAIQHAKGYAPLKIRNTIIPITQFGSMISTPIFIIGLILSFQPLLTIGIFLFTAVVFFQLITLPVEFNASRRAIATLDENHILDDIDLPKAKKVLMAAGLTYLAALFSALASLFRLIVLSKRNN